MYELIIDKKDGTLWTLECMDVQWATVMKGKPATLKFQVFNDEKVMVENGDIVRLIRDDLDLFYGYVFAVDRSKEDVLSITAYDQIRYLLFNDTYASEYKKASEIIQDIGNKYSLKVGHVEDTGEPIMNFFQEDKKVLDMIYKALDDTLVITGDTYVFWDDFGSLELRHIKELRENLVLGDDSLMTDFNHKLDIDKETYNVIKFSKTSPESGNTATIAEVDFDSVGKWGLLQYYKKMDDDANYAQISERAKMLLQLKNRPQESLSVDAIGNFRIRAGKSVIIRIDALGIDQHFLVEEAKHKLSNNGHTMNLKLKVI